MISQEFILTRINFFEEQPQSSEVLFDPTITEKAKQLTFLQRQKPMVVKNKKSTVFQVVKKSAG